MYIKTRIYASKYIILYKKNMISNYNKNGLRRNKLIIVKN